MINTNMTVQAWQDSGQAMPPVLLVKGESQGRKLSMRLVSDGRPVDLTSAATVTLRYIKPSGMDEYIDMAVEDAASGLVSVVMTSQSCAEAGEMRACVVRVTYASGANLRIPGPRIRVLDSASDDAIQSSNEYQQLDMLILNASQSITDMEALEADLVNKRDSGYFTGPQGPQGADGRTATVTVGTTTTGDVGQAASVTNVGTVNDAVFNFTIPQGPQGIPGVWTGAIEDAPNDSQLVYDPTGDPTSLPASWVEMADGTTVQTAVTSLQENVGDVQTELDGLIESGTWTPTVYADNTQVTGITYSRQIGRWARSGNLVFVQFQIQFNGDLSSYSENRVRIGGVAGLPTFPSVGAYGGAVLTTRYYDGQLLSYVVDDYSEIQIYKQGFNSFYFEDWGTLTDTSKDWYLSGSFTYALEPQQQEE